MKGNLKQLIRESLSRSGVTILYEGIFKILITKERIDGSFKVTVYKEEYKDYIIFLPAVRVNYYDVADYLNDLNLEKHK